MPDREVLVLAIPTPPLRLAGLLVGALVLLPSVAVAEAPLWATDVEHASEFAFDPSACEQPLLLSEVFKDVGFGVQEEVSTLTASAMSDADERSLGLRLHPMLALTAFTGDYPWVESYLDELLDQITRYASRDLMWQSHVYDDEFPNAYAVPGGYIYVSTGMLGMLENEAQLVAILAHEVGHHEGRHSILRFQYLKALGIWNPNDDGSLTQSTLTALEIPFISKQEEVADAFAVNVLIELGYSPYQLVRFMLLMQELFYGEEEALGDSFAAALLPELRNLLEDHPRPLARACAAWRDIALRVDFSKDPLFYVGRANLRDLTPRARVVY